jgi:hypothetical protein
LISGPGGAGGVGLDVCGLLFGIAVVVVVDVVFGRADVDDDVDALVECVGLLELLLELVPCFLTEFDEEDVVFLLLCSIYN